MNTKPLFVTAIGTDIGKTVVSAILVEKLKADYWKPIQSGDLHQSDTMKVKALISNAVTQFHAEAYRLTQPFSPHKSAELDGVHISLENIVLPQTTNHLIIEGAGGLMVPFNDNDMVIDLIQKVDAEAVLVIKHYLGSINHTLLSLELLKQKNIKVKALIFNGARDKYSENIIKRHAGSVKHIYIAQKDGVIDKQFILEQAHQIEL
jgi:dethiobiotin synthetase